MQSEQDVKHFVHMNWNSLKSGTADCCAPEGGLQNTEAVPGDRGSVVWHNRYLKWKPEIHV